MQYKFVKELGSGSFGKVNLVVDEKGNNWAMKTLEPGPAVQQFVSPSELKTRFEREVRYQCKFSHPNVVKIIDFDIMRHPHIS